MVVHAQTGVMVTMNAAALKDGTVKTVVKKYKNCLQNHQVPIWVCGRFLFGNPYMLCLAIFVCVMVAISDLPVLFNQFLPGTRKRAIGKRCRPRSDAT